MQNGTNDMIALPLSDGLSDFKHVHTGLVTRGDIWSCLSLPRNSRQLHFLYKVQSTIRLSHSPILLCHSPWQWVNYIDKHDSMSQLLILCLSIFTILPYPIIPIVGIMNKVNLPGVCVQVTCNSHNNQPWLKQSTQCARLWSIIIEWAKPIPVNWLSCWESNQPYTNDDMEAARS